MVDLSEMNKSTRLAVRFLVGDTANREDAFQGLIAICLKAKGGIFISSNRSMEPSRGYRELVFDATRGFIVVALTAILQPYDGKGEKEIMLAASKGKFRCIPRIVRYRMIDHLRRGENRRRRRADFGKRAQQQWRAEHDTLLAIWSLYSHPDGRIDFDKTEAFNKLTRRERKGRIIAAIAERRVVSLQQARADNRVWGWIGSHGDDERDQIEQGSRLCDRKTSRAGVAAISNGFILGASGTFEYNPDLV